MKSDIEDNEIRLIPVTNDEFDYEITFEEEFTFAPSLDPRRIVDGYNVIEDE